MEKRVLLLDVDEVICFSGFLPLINEFLGTKYVIDDFSDYYIDEAAIPKKLMPLFNDFVRKRNLYENAELLPRAAKTIEKLNEFYDIYILSSCVNPLDVEGSCRLFSDKYKFLRENLSFISPKKYIFTSSKNLVLGDIQIDDLVSNLNDNVDTKILFPSYHNKDISQKELKEKNIICAGYDYREAWKTIENMLLTSEMIHKPKKYNLKVNSNL